MDGSSGLQRRYGVMGVKEDTVIAEEFRAGGMNATMMVVKEDIRMMAIEDEGRLWCE